MSDREAEPPALPGEMWRGDVCRNGEPWLAAVAPQPSIPHMVTMVWVVERWEIASVWQAAEAMEEWAMAERTRGAGGHSLTVERASNGRVTLRSDDEPGLRAIEAMAEGDVVRVIAGKGGV